MKHALVLVVAYALFVTVLWSADYFVEPKQAATWECGATDITKTPDNPHQTVTQSEWRPYRYYGEARTDGKHWHAKKGVDY